MALPNRQQFSNARENFSNAVRGSRVDGRQLQAAPSAQQNVPQQQTYLSQDPYLQEILQKRAQEMPKPQQPKRQILPPGYISTQDPTNTFGEFKNLTSTEVEYLKKGNKPYFRMTDQEVLNFKNTGTVPKIGRANDTPTRQDVPQQQVPVMPQQLQQLQSMINSYQLKLNSDSFLSNLRQQQQQLGAAIHQRHQGYLNSIQQFFNTAPPELKQFLTSPQVMQNINMAYSNSQPEVRQIQDLNRQYTEYVQTNYGEEQRRLQELQQQAEPVIQQYQNQMRLFNQQNVRSLQGQTPSTVINEKAVQSTPLPTQNPYTSTTAVDSTGTPRTGIQPVQQQPTVKPEVDPIRTSIFKPPTPLNPIKQEPVKPIVDPKIEPVRPPIGLATQPTIKPEVDPIKTPTTTSGLGNKPKKRKSSSIRPSQYTDLNTSVKGLMNNGV